MNKNCETKQDRIAELMTEHSDPYSDRELAGHLKDCSKCRQYFNDLTVDAQRLSDFIYSMRPAIARIESSVSKKFGCDLTTQRVKPNSIWRVIMNNRMARSASAAMIMLAGLIAVIYLEKTATPAFGMTEALNKYRNAKTIYTHGWVYMPASRSTKPEFIKVPIEHWFDLENGCYKMIKPGSWNR